MKNKQIIEFNIDEMVFGGESLNLTEFDKKVTMKGGIIGQKVKAVIQKKEKTKFKLKYLK